MRDPESVLRRQLLEFEDRLHVLILALEMEGFESEELREALTTIQEYFDG